MAKGSNRKEYVPYFADKAIDTRFPYEAPFEHELVTSKDRLCELLFGLTYAEYTEYADNDINDERIKAKHDMVAWDTETDGLNWTKHHIVGFSMTFPDNRYKGYYFPIDHFYHPEQCLGAEALDIMWHFLIKVALVLIYNVRFDLRMVEYHNLREFKRGWDGHPSDYLYGGEQFFKAQGFKSRFEHYDPTLVKYFDVLVPLWMSDSNLGDSDVSGSSRGGKDKVGKISLKRMSLRFLGWEQPTFASVVGDDNNFYMVTPEDAKVYASCDTICLFNLYPIAKRFHDSFGWSGTINQRIHYFVNEYEERNSPLDVESTKRLEAELDERVAELKEEIFSAVGYFNYNSPTQIERVFLQLGLDTGVVTDSGKMSFSKEAIDTMLGKPNLSKKQRAFAEAFKDLKKLEKLNKDFVKQLLKHNEECNGLRFGYNTVKVATGRFSSSRDKKNDYFSQYASNTQQIPKGKTTMYYIREAVPSDHKDDFTILKWRIDTDYHRLSQGGEVKHCLEAQSLKRNIRSAFRAEKGTMWVSCDFCISPDVWVETPNGKKQLKDLQEGELVKTPQGFKRAYNIRYTGAKKRVRVTLKDGRSVVCSEDHKFLVDRKGTLYWLAVKDIQLGDNIISEELT